MIGISRGSDTSFLLFQSSAIDTQLWQSMPSTTRYTQFQPLNRAGVTVTFDNSLMSVRFSGSLLSAIVCYILLIVIAQKINFD